MPDECSEFVNHSLVQVEENKRKARFRNPAKKEYKITEIDDCIVKEGVRADWLISEIGNASVLIELKGSDVKHACDQLFASAEHLDVKPLLEKRIGFLVVCSKYPRFDTFVIKAKQHSANKYRCGFHVVQDKGEFDIERIVAIDGPK
jgi:hypothetical protein